MRRILLGRAAHVEGSLLGAIDLGLHRVTMKIVTKYVEYFLGCTSIGFLSVPHREQIVDDSVKACLILVSYVHGGSTDVNTKQRP